MENISFTSFLSSPTHRNGKGIMVLDKIFRMKAGCSFIVYVEIFVFKHALKTKVKTFHKPSRQSSVCRASVLSQLVRLVCFILDLSPHQCLDMCKYVWLKKHGHHAGNLEVSRCCTRDESEESIVHRQWSTSCLALKPRADVTRCPKQSISVPTKRNDVLNFYFEKRVNIS